MLKGASLILAASLFSLIHNSQVVAQTVAAPAPVPGGGGSMVTRISNRCRGANPTKLTADERSKAQKTARWNAGLSWKIEDVDVHKCKSNNLMEVRVEARPLDNDNHEPGVFLFFESHKSFRKALTLHSIKCPGRWQYIQTSSRIRREELELFENFYDSRRIKRCRVHDCHYQGVLPPRALP